MDAKLNDLSTEGCCIATCEPIQVGEMVSVRMEGLEPWNGTVVWADEGQIGVKFDRALHGAVVDHYARNNPRAE